MMNNCCRRPPRTAAGVKQASVDFRVFTADIGATFAPQQRITGGTLRPAVFPPLPIATAIKASQTNMDSRFVIVYNRLVSKADLHRTTIDIEVDAFEAARAALGTSGYRATVNDALREVARTAALRRAAAALRAGGVNLASPEDIAAMRRLRA